MIRFAGTYGKVLWQLLMHRFDLCYLAITCQGIGFLKDTPFVLLCKLFCKKVVVHQHNKGMLRVVHRFPYSRLLPWVYQNVDVILHDLPNRNDTVRLGLEALGDLDACMFLPGDQPLLRRETVAMLLENWKENPDRIIRPVYEDTEGSPVIFPSWAIPELKSLPEGKGGSVVIKNHPNDVLRISVRDPFELADADTPQTLELLKGLCYD